ncbi:ABC transporter ATP-binding protein [Martelella radicis]|uniref:Spermidine/putrescine import ATP-binding protein PotA n=1 Tax=Martelella radicis TaxID=1397476 RepID=A0A7W6PAX1_9HYPH|nr:ABC transporter ATP-binding protein [Martelella radicis]MBB4122049.1 putative spermidine/putrescine transport system ATP-binding protein [Martelella radicis]
MDGQVVIRDVEKNYGAFRALDKVSLDIEPGEFVTLLGPSGSGKTTLLNVLAGFTRPDSGSVRMDGTEFLTLPPHKRNLGMVFQSYALFPHMTVIKNVGYPLKLRKVARPEIERRAREALDVVKMGHLADREISALSGGQRQRVALARAMVFEPKILLMDEPLSALDKNLREHMQIELKRLHDQLGTTTVYVTHDQREALTMSDRIAVINHGQLAQYDTPSRLYDHPANRFVAEFIGESGFLPVKVGANGPSLFGEPVVARDPWRGGDQAWLLLRPERMAWSEPAGPANRVVATVCDVLYQGDSFLLSLELPDGVAIDVRCNPHSANIPVPNPGESISFWISQQNTLLVEGEA